MNVSRKLTHLDELDMTNSTQMLGSLAHELTDEYFEHPALQRNTDSPQFVAIPLGLCKILLVTVDCDEICTALIFARAGEIAHDSSQFASGIMLTKDEIVKSNRSLARAGSFDFSRQSAVLSAGGTKSRHSLPVWYQVPSSCVSSALKCNPDRLLNR